MALFPGANVRLINKIFLDVAPIAVHNRVNLHAQGGLGTLFDFKSHTNRPSSHFWVSQTGVVEQYVDTSIQAEADLDGNDATVSIETEGGVDPTAQTEQWTPPQLQAITALVAWIMSTHQIELKLATDAKPGPSSHGLSWHRLGIDGNFPELPDMRAGRKQRGGGMHYSTQTGKVCPGDAKIAQIPGILAAITGGAVVVPPVVVPPPPPPPPPPGGAVDVDGFWGSATTTRAQVVLGQAPDGQVRFQFLKNKQPAMTSGWVFDFAPGHGSPLISRMQEVMAAAGQYQGTVDGVAGPEFTKGLERRFGTQVDGTLEAKSLTVMALQRALNGGAF
ncbi:peptidoglycan recognition protein family protein [Cellulomonas sp. McL0617]|uniref:peptidoglycan recognition protein family protein n=1 Tax=Cellulomonas sp. McL0617 TaxID=3415675 RepID=UPI003CF4BFDA